MISNVDVIREHKCSWMIWSLNVRKNISTYRFILNAIKDKSTSYGIIIFNTFINITEFRNTFNKDKKKFVKLLYNTIKGCIVLNVEKFVWNIKQTFKHDNNRNIVFE